MGSKGIHNLTYGMYLLTCRENDRDYGCLVNTAMQVSSKPDRIAVCVVKRNLTHEILLRTGFFNLSTITEDTPFSLFRTFGMTSGRKTDKFEAFPAPARSTNGLIYSAAFSNMYLSVRITDQIDLDDHTLFIGEVTEDVLLCGKPACTYDYYLKKITPKSSL